MLSVLRAVCGVICGVLPYFVMAKRKLVRRYPLLCRKNNDIVLDIVYNYVDENGETKQKWETRTSYQDALKRKAEVENQQYTGTFLPPSDQTIKVWLPKTLAYILRE